MVEPSRVKVVPRRPSGDPLLDVLAVLVISPDPLTDDFSLFGNIDIRLQKKTLA